MTGPIDDFFTAIILGDLKKVESILPEHPEAISWLTPAGYPPLHMAILNHRDKIAVLLVENGASLSQEAQGETAASLADRKGMLERLQQASIAGPRRRQENVEQCGDNMRGGLKEPITVPRRKLSLKKSPKP